MHGERHATKEKRRWVLAQKEEEVKEKKTLGEHLNQRQEKKVHGVSDFMKENAWRT